MPGELILDARKDVVKAVTKAGYDYIMMDEKATRFGGVETRDEGRLYAKWLAEHKGEFDGVIFSMPIFADENGAITALQDAGVPILMQAYPDEIGLMDFSHRRDAVCGKIAMCNVLRQAGIKYTLTKKFAVRPDTPGFAEDLRNFAAVCRIVNGMRDIYIGAIGARTTAFKTVRFDEIAYQKNGINIETFDMSQVFAMMDSADADAVAAKKAKYFDYADFTGVEAEKADSIARFGVTLDALIERYSLKAVAIRCWDELEKRYGISPCLAMSVLNDAGIAAACEMDVNNAVMMRAVALASDSAVGLFDVNNNYGDATDRAIMFHCSAIPGSMLSCKGCIGEHLMFKKAYGPRTGVGIFGGEVRQMPLTVGSFKTENGKLCGFVTEGESTADPIEKEFFGTGFVFKKDDNDANAMLNYMSLNGYRHHVAFVRGNWAEAVVEAFSNYLGWEIDRI
jgi:L-fucose isomerase-like protein